jgi:hypothetical protein
MHAGAAADAEAGFTPVQLSEKALDLERRAQALSALEGACVPRVKKRKKTS